MGTGQRRPGDLVAATFASMRSVEWHAPSSVASTAKLISLSRRGKGLENQARIAVNASFAAAIVF
jgi:hypothetical protein